MVTVLFQTNTGNFFSGYDPLVHLTEGDPFPLVRLPGTPSIKDVFDRNMAEARRLGIQAAITKSVFPNAHVMFYDDCRLGWGVSGTTSDEREGNGVTSCIFWYRTPRNVRIPQLCNWLIIPDHLMRIAAGINRLNPRER